MEVLKTILMVIGGIGLFVVGLSIAVSIAYSRGWNPFK